MSSELFSAFEHLVVLDTETTGITHKTDEIIELAAMRAVPGSSGLETAEEMDLLIRLSPGRSLPPEIAALTGITPDMLQREGVESAEAAWQLVK